MALEQIRPTGHRTLRWHGAVLAFWSLAVGLLVNLVLLHGLQVHAMALRYAAGVGATYFLGLLAGGWFYAQWCAASDRRMAAHLQHATAEERDAGPAAASGQKSSFLEKLGNAFDVGDLGEDLGGLLVGIACFVGVLLLFFVAWTGLPMLAANLLAGYLAEIVLEFVIGAAVYRHVKKPRPLNAYWGFMLRRTGLAGVFAVVLAGAAGYALQRNVPDAVTLGQAIAALF